MISPGADFATVVDFDADVAVVGAGPVGIVTALAFARRGFRVLLLESGQDQPTRQAQELSRAFNVNPDNHHDPEITVSRRLGGTSNLWGGRCLPYDALDYQARNWLDLPGWPINQSDLLPYQDEACTMLAAGDAAAYQSGIESVTADDAFTFESLERWSNVPRTHVLHRRELTQSQNLLVVLGATVVGFDYAENGRIKALETHLEGHGTARVPVREVVLAAGGNECTRLLLAEKRRHDNLFSDQLGRCYMGHLAGCISDIVFANREFHDGLDFLMDEHRSYVRRRIVPSAKVQEANGLANIAFWPVVPEIHNPAHRSGPLSAVFLALSVAPLGRRIIAEAIRRQHIGEPPYRRLSHIANILRDPFSTVGFTSWLIWKRKFSKPRLPGLFMKNPARRYGLEFHAEHMPSPDSRLTLSDETDRLGLPRLTIDLRFSEADALSVLRAHDEIGEWLNRNCLAELHYRHPREGRMPAILAQAKHGNHQIGTIRMGSSRRNAIVDANCRAFDVPNLSVVSTAVLPTSGHGNPTMAAVQLGLRLADQMAAARHPLPVAVPA